MCVRLSFKRGCMRQTKLDKSQIARALLVVSISLVSLGGTPAAFAQAQPKASPAAPAAPAAGLLPGGASSLQENFEDWSIVCTQAASGPVCALTQVQVDSQSQQRMLAVELKVQANDQISGAVVLPFGLAVARGVTLQFDDGSASATMPFRTCVPAGCLVPLSFSGTSLASLKQAKVLNVNAVAAEGEGPVKIPISLKGFSAALLRIAAISADVRRTSKN